MPRDTTTGHETGIQSGSRTDTQSSSDARTNEQSSQLVAGPESALEAAMREIAQRIYTQYSGEALDPNAFGGVTAQSVLAGGVSDAQRGMVNDWQTSTLNASRAGMQGLFNEQVGAISNNMADRGIIDSSAYGSAVGGAQRDLERQYGAMAAQTQAQAAQQLMGFSTQNQNIGMSFLQQRQQAREWAANPQLMRDMMEYRLRTGQQVSRGTSAGITAGSSASNSSGRNESWSVEGNQTPTDWAGFLLPVGELIAGLATANPALAIGGAAGLASKPYESGGQT